jgi:hypothetical protein
MSYHQPQLSESDWDIQAGVASRLEERDKADADWKPDVDDRDTLSDRAAQRAEWRIQQERDQKRKFSEDRTKDIHRAVTKSYQNQQAKEVYRPKAPTSKNPDADLRTHIADALDFHSMPLADQQSYAANIREMEAQQKAAINVTGKELSPAEMMMVNDRAGGQQLSSPEMAEANRIIEGTALPIVDQAQSMGVDPTQYTQQLIAGDTFARQNPLAAADYFAQAGGEEKIGHYMAMARNSGVSLSSALDNYVRAEQLLERDPVAGIKWLMANYGVRADQLTDEYVIR